MNNQDLLSEWINSLKEDFPEYNSQIEKLDLNIELVEDYYFCKERLKQLEESQQPRIFKEFRLMLDELKGEIRDQLHQFHKGSV